MARSSIQKNPREVLSGKFYILKSVEIEVGRDSPNKRTRSAGDKGMDKNSNG